MCPGIILSITVGKSGTKTHRKYVHFFSLVWFWCSATHSGHVRTQSSGVCVLRHFVLPLYNFLHCNLQGKSWIHVATNSDMPFKSVSVGGGYRVWAIAVDGSVWYRPGVTPHTPAGKTSVILTSKHYKCFTVDLTVCAFVAPLSLLSEHFCWKSWRCNDQLPLLYFIQLWHEKLLVPWYVGKSVEFRHIRIQTYLCR